jgi:hypothetical protein
MPAAASSKLAIHPIDALTLTAARLLRSLRRCRISCSTTPTAGYELSARLFAYVRDVPTTLVVS